MSYVVLSTDATGQQKVEDVGSLDDALQLVERLRNDDHVDDVRVLREVPIEVKTYYKVVALEDDASGGTGEAPRSIAPPVGASPTGPDGSPAEADGPSFDTSAVPVQPPVAEPVAGAVSAPSDGPGLTGAGDDGFFTPPPVRSHPIEEDGTPPDGSPPSERRTSLFGRG